MTEPLIHN